MSAGFRNKAEIFYTMTWIDLLVHALQVAQAEGHTTGPPLTIWSGSHRSNSNHLLSTYCVPSKMLSSAFIITFDPHNSPGSYYFNSHFRVEKMKSWRHY